MITTPSSKPSTSATTPTPSTPPVDVQVEQLLEALSVHVASNNRVVIAVERLEREFPNQATAILHAHREALAAMPVPVVRLPPPPADPNRRLVDAIYITGAITSGLTVLIGCGIIYLFFHR